MLLGNMGDACILASELSSVIRNWQGRCDFSPSVEINALEGEPWLSDPS